MIERFLCVCEMSICLSGFENQLMICACCLLSDSLTAFLFLCLSVCVSLCLCSLSLCVLSFCANKNKIERDREVFSVQQQEQQHYSSSNQQHQQQHAVNAIRMYRKRGKNEEEEKNNNTRLSRAFKTSSAAMIPHSSSSTQRAMLRFAHCTASEGVSAGSKRESVFVCVLCVSASFLVPQDTR